ncbi:hypothetical protein IW142_001529 [Coemansia sp. RSA 564]|nr:hypothetical protein IW142_001529 [Coemansia sp. RSA 564]
MRFLVAIWLSLMLGIVCAAPPQHAFMPHRASTNKSLDASPWLSVTTMPALPNYQLRVKQPNLCDNVTQYSGYLDTSEDKHFFFWFFEARNKHDETPIMLWLNGGPGCSSFTGLLMELGPCRVDGNRTVRNPHAWNDRAHIIFVDQPTNVGFSYGSDVFTSLAAGADMVALLQLFYTEFPQYARSELHIFGESYAGHYVPAIAKTIHEMNVEHKERQQQGLLSIAEQQLRVLPLASIGIGNGFVDPLVQYKYASQMACNSTYGPILTREECNKMDSLYPTCARLARSCYNWPSRLTCVPAMMMCDRIDSVYSKTGRNPYDVRRECTGDLCYPIMDDIDTYLNDPRVQKELGAEVSKFESCSEKVGYGFGLTGDAIKPFHQEIPPLLASGIRVLVYAGDADYICNWYGNKAWTMEMEWTGQELFNAAADKVWMADGVEGGEARAFGNLTFVRVFGAGHMVPYDQPVAALTMVNQWLGL